MTQKEEGLGDRYHQETKYSRTKTSWGGLDWANQPSPYKEDLAPLKRFPIRQPSLEGGKPIWQAITERRSIREFSSQPISFSALSQLIWATQGITLRAWGYEFRTAPSAGGLYPIETYLLVNRVEEILSGIYHYNVEEAQVVLLKEGSFGGKLARAGLDQGMLEEAAAVFIWTALVERSKWKYRERAYRYIYMDAGHIGQNLYLAATALNLGCCTVGAFFDEEVDRLIGIDGRREISVYMGAVGPIR